MWQQSEYHKFARKLVYFISVIIDMRGGWGCVWNTHTCPLLVSLKPAKACPVNRFAKKTWHDLLSPRQFTSCEIVYMCTQWNSDHITWQVRLWRVLNNSANTQSVEFKKVLHHLSQNFFSWHNNVFFIILKTLRKNFTWPKSSKWTGAHIGQRLKSNTGKNSSTIQWIEIMMFIAMITCQI